MNQYQKEYAEFLRGFLVDSSQAQNDRIGRQNDKQKKLKVVFDCSNGTTGIILEKLFKANLLINQFQDGNFPAHGPDPLKPGAMSQLQKEVKKQKADLGVIFDADGDRAFFVDEKGRVVDPDIVASLLIWELKSKKVVVNETTSNIIRESRIMNNELRIIKSQNGGYFIKNAMIKNNADFGCERSGHYYFKIIHSTLVAETSFTKGQAGSGNRNKCFFMDSGILAAIYVINAISKLPYGLLDFADLSQKYYRSGNINIKIDKNELQITNYELFKKISDKLEKYFLSHNSRFKILNSSRIDGLRMDFEESGLPDRSLGGGWWFNIQLSNTEPLMRLNIEASSKQTLANQKKMLLKLLRNGI